MDPLRTILNEVFEGVRNQILPMDPLPSVSKAYYLISQVEKQKQVVGLINSNEDLSLKAMYWVRAV